MRSWLALVVLLVGCGASYIPNTTVEDSSQNRRVVAFCEDYRRAIEDKNMGRLLSLASTDYRDPAKDYEGLRAFVTGIFQQTTQIRYNIRYQRVTFAENGHVLVQFTYAASYKVPGAKGEPEWRHSVAKNQLDLVPDGESFKIVSGM